MRGYAAKVGLRKPGTLAWARAQLGDPHLTTDEWDEFIEYQSAHLTPAQVNAFAPWVVDPPTPTIRGTARDIWDSITGRREATTCQHCTCTYTAECCYCDGGQVHR